VAGRRASRGAWVGLRKGLGIAGWLVSDHAKGRKVRRTASSGHSPVMAAPRSARGAARGQGGGYSGRQTRRPDV